MAKRKGSMPSHSWKTFLAPSPFFSHACLQPRFSWENSDKCGESAHFRGLLLVAAVTLLVAIRTRASRIVAVFSGKHGWAVDHKV